MSIPQFIHSPTDGHWICFHVLAVMTNVVIGVSFGGHDLFLIYPGVELLGCRVSLWFVLVDSVK